LYTKHVPWDWLHTLADTAELSEFELVTDAVHASVDLTGGRRSGHWIPEMLPMHLWLFSDHQRIPDSRSGRGSDKHPVRSNPYQMRTPSLLLAGP
jgi:hypothetical protein